MANAPTVEQIENIGVQVKGIADRVEGFTSLYDKRLAAQLDPIREALNKQREILGAPALGFDGSEHDDGGFSSFGEFIRAVRFDPTDTRLRELESRALEAGTGSSGGFLIPTQHLNTVLSAPTDQAFFRPLAAVMPAGAYPDAPIDVPCLDQEGSDKQLGGVSVHWLGEGATLSETDVDLRLVTLEPNEVGAYITANDKLLRNTELASQVVSSLLGRAIIAAEEDSFIQGAGGGRPLGFLGHTAELTVTRNSSSHIEFVDLAKMLGKAAWCFGNYVWVISQTCLEDLLTLTDGSGRLIWTQRGDSIDGMPLNLLGRPVKIYSGSPTLGNKGDIMLVSPEAYLIKNGSPMRIEASQHPLFTAQKTIIRAVWSVDGKPWLHGPLTLRDGETQVSPFVVLE